MGILDDFKRLFWVKKAVAESAAEKAADKTKEFGDEFSEKAADGWKKTKEVAEDVGEKIVQKTKEGIGEVKEMWTKKDDWTPTEKTPVKEESGAFKTGEKIGEKVAEVTDAAGKTWDKAKEEGKEILDKAVKTSDKVWEKTEQVTEDLWDKAKKAATNVGEKWNEGVDSMLEKAKELDKKIEEERDKIDPNRDGWADKTVHDKMKEHESVLKDKDDFFEKAKRFGDGDYSMGKPIVTRKPGDSDTKDGMTELPPLPEDDDFADDAILDEDPKDKS